jgi:hypothetical protein
MFMTKFPILTPTLVRMVHSGVGFDDGAAELRVTFILDTDEMIVMTTNNTKNSSATTVATSAAAAATVPAATAGSGEDYQRNLHILTLTTTIDPSLNKKKTKSSDDGVEYQSSSIKALQWRIADFNYITNTDDVDPYYDPFRRGNEVLLGLIDVIRKS